MGQAVARKNGTDSVATNHGCQGTTVTNEGSGNVNVNGIGVVRRGDQNQSHTVPSGRSCVPHTVALSSSSSTVFVNGRGIGRRGDSYGNETITSGSPNVYAG